MHVIYVFIILNDTARLIEKKKKNMSNCDIDWCINQYKGEILSLTQVKHFCGRLKEYLMTKDNIEVVHTPV